MSSCSVIVGIDEQCRVELRGTVGSIYIKEFGNTRCVNFSVATNHCFKDRDGCPVIETTWHRVIAWENQDTADAFKLEKGSPVSDRRIM